MAPCRPAQVPIPFYFQILISYLCKRVTSAHFTKFQNSSTPNSGCAWLPFRPRPRSSRAGSASSSGPRSLGAPPCRRSPRRSPPPLQLLHMGWGGLNVRVAHDRRMPSLCPTPERRLWRLLRGLLVELELLCPLLLLDLDEALLLLTEEGLAPRHLVLGNACRTTHASVGRLAGCLASPSPPK